jgi:hypothetical protein
VNTWSADKLHNSYVLQPVCMYVSNIYSKEHKEMYSRLCYFENRNSAAISCHTIRWLWHSYYWHQHLKKYYIIHLILYFALSLKMYLKKLN